MYVEKQPWKVTDEEDEYESHEDGGKVVFEAAPTLVDVLHPPKKERAREKEKRLRRRRCDR